MALIKHSDFTPEQHDYIVRNIEVVNKREAFWSRFTEKDTMPKADNIRYRKQILIDHAYAGHILKEGETPTSESLKVAEFKANVFNIGSYIEYTRENLINLDSIASMISEQLAHDRLLDLETIRFNAFAGTSATLTKGTTWTDTIMGARVALVKNKAKPVAGQSYALVVVPETGSAITKELGEVVKFVPSMSDDIWLNGFVGKALGFDIFECAEAYMYTTEAPNGLAFFIGKDEQRRFPVIERSFAGTNATVYDKSVDDVDSGDPLGQKGFVASRIDGVGAVLTASPCVLKLVSDATKVESAYDPEEGNIASVEVGA